MPGHLELLRAIRIGQPVYAVALSGDGQYVAVGSERGLSLYDVVGNRRLAYPAPGEPLPVAVVATTPDLTRLLVGTRDGVLKRLKVRKTEGLFTARDQTVCEIANDLNSLSLSADGERVALGHLSPALTMLQSDGRLLWRRHPEDGTATRNRVWSVAFNAQGDTLYVGSAGTGSNALVRLAADTGEPRASRLLDDQLVRLAYLSEAEGVVAVLTSGSYQHRVVAYGPDLQEVLWEADFGGPVTALGSDPVHDLLAVAAGYEGQIMVLQGASGKVMTPSHSLRSVVNGLAISIGSRLVAGTQDGHIVWLHYESGGLQL